MILWPLKIHKVAKLKSLAQHLLSLSSQTREAEFAMLRPLKTRKAAKLKYQEFVTLPTPSQVVKIPLSSEALK